MHFMRPTAAQEAFVNPHHLRVLVTPYENGRKFAVTITRGPHECCCKELYTTGPQEVNRTEAVRMARLVLGMACGGSHPVVGNTPVLTPDLIELIIAELEREPAARTYEPKFRSASPALAC